MASASEELSADEIALYDRQLRLWGIEAQNRMRKAKVLLITIKALGNEVAKNLVLAGIGSLTIVDPGDVTDKDVSSQFCVTKEDIGKNVLLHLIFADCVTACGGICRGGATSESQGSRSCRPNFNLIEERRFLPGL
jgi:molybdopterin/thiamine biosynthesis adenylyltransferase